MGSRGRDGLTFDADSLETELTETELTETETMLRLRRCLAA